MKRTTRLFVFGLIFIASTAGVCRASETPEGGDVPTRGIHDFLDRVEDGMDYVDQGVGVAQYLAGAAGEADGVVDGVQDFIEDVQDGNTEEVIEDVIGCLGRLGQGLQKVLIALRRRDRQGQ